MINIEAVKKVLESQGKLDFKPFHFDNAKQDYWAYKTNDSKFHVCDNDLKELSYYELRDIIDNVRCFFFVVDSDQCYFILKEGKPVATLHEEQPDNPIINILIVNGFDGIFSIKDIPGYRYINDDYTYYIIFEPNLIDIKQQDNTKYWIPDKQVSCYYDNFELNESNVFYCGTYNDWSDLFFCDEKYYMRCKDLDGRDSWPHYFDNLVIWFSKSGIMLIDIYEKEGIRKIEIYNQTIDKDICIGSYTIDLNISLKDINYIVGDNLFVLSHYQSQTSSWIAIDRCGNLGCVIKNKGGKIVSVNNDIIRLETSSWSNDEKKYDFYDYEGCCIATGVNKKTNFVIVTKTYNPTFLFDDSENNIITFKGVLNSQNHKLVVPIKYKKLEPFDAGDLFYAIIGEEYTNSSGERAIQFGLWCNDGFLLPCNKEEIKTISDNMFVWKEDDKYGLISNGKRCCECIYDSISIAKSIGRTKKYSHKRYFPALHNYKEHFYALIQDGNHYGIFVPDWDMFIRPTFNNIIAFVEEKFFFADDKIYSIKGDDFIFVKDMSEYEYIGGLKNYHLYKLKNGDRDSVDNYTCLCLKNGELEDEDITDAELDDKIEADRDYIIWSNYNPVLALGDGNVFYSVKENVFYDDINSLASYPEPDMDESYNYERDTYYALGGDNYDQWKENGGDLDDMMEGMGF